MTVVPSTPYRNIALTGLVVFALLLISGVILVAIDQDTLGASLIGAAVGQVSGTALTTTTVAKSNNLTIPEVLNGTKAP